MVEQNEAPSPRGHVELVYVLAGKVVGGGVDVEVLPAFELVIATVVVNPNVVIRGTVIVVGGVLPIVDAVIIVEYVLAGKVVGEGAKDEVLPAFEVVIATLVIIPNVVIRGTVIVVGGVVVVVLPLIDAVVVVGKVVNDTVEFTLRNVELAVVAGRAVEADLLAQVPQH